MAEGDVALAVHVDGERVRAEGIGLDGEGTKIGPDLTGMSVHPKHELLAHLIDPSRSVEANYRVYSVLTSEGQTLKASPPGRTL